MYGTKVLMGSGAQEQTPILTLHGGQGVPSAYIEDMTQLASDTRRVILYDQLSCGHSNWVAEAKQRHSSMK